MTYPVVAMMLAISFALPPGGTFIDDDANPHEGAIEAIAAEGITKGCNPELGDRFCPGDVVTRGQMAAFFDRALGLDPGPDRFVDDDGHLFEGAIARLAAAGITRGCNPPDNDRFCPDEPMTRGAMAAMLNRAFDYPAPAEDPFVDDDGHLFEADIARLAGAGVTKGCNPPENDRFCPDGVVTRDQMATFLMRSLGLPPIDPPPRPVPSLVVLPREDWGARNAQTSRMTPHSIDRLTVHHAGTQTGTTGPSQFRGWQRWHMDGQGWPDIAYHFIVGLDGTIYEGRDPDFRGDTATSYDPTGHFLVVVEGNFEVEEPTEAQIESLTRVLAWAAATYGVSPETIAGHRDYAATTCPGEALHTLIETGELAADVTRIMGALP